MATGLRRIEKEFILTNARDEGTRLLLIAGAGEWPVEIKAIEREEIHFSHSMPLRLLKKGQVHEYRFVYRDQAMAFRAKILEAKEGLLITEMPEQVYRNLARRYTRRPPPSELRLCFSLKGERYKLSFPTSPGFTLVSKPEASPDFDPGDIRALLRDFNAKAEDFASNRTVVMFKERGPQSIEERIIVRTGKALYIPSAAGGLPLSDPLPNPSIITRALFADFLREEGVAEDGLDEELEGFEKGKAGAGTISEMLIPVLFQEYVIGYVHLENKTPGKAPFDLGVFETFQLFTEILAYSLLINGYFKGAPKKSQDFTGMVADLSAGGVLFSTASPDIAQALVSEARLDLGFTIGTRKFKAAGIVRRVYRDSERCYFGLEYDEIEPEDFRYLFETLYGRPFCDSDAISIEGLTVKAPLIKF